MRAAVEYACALALIAFCSAIPLAIFVIGTGR